MNKFRSVFKNLDWTNTLFLTLTPIIAFVGTGFLVAHNAIHWATVVLAVVWAVLTGLGITAGYHRLFSHLAYKATWPYRLFMLCFGAAAFENSALSWSSDHRVHHKFVDTPQDPYNIKQGFFHAHMGWVMKKSGATHRHGNVTDLMEDPLVMFQHRHYVKIGILFGFILPTAIAASWGDPLGGFFIAGFLRTVMNHHFTFSINSFAHLIGTQPYSDRDSSRDYWGLALVTYGEGYHNYHHRFPTDYRNGIRFYHWDPTKWTIRALSHFGLTYDLRQVPAEAIVRARLNMDQKRLLSRISTAGERRYVPQETVDAARARLEEAYRHFQQLRAEYARSRHEKLENLTAAMRPRLETLRADIANARERLKEASAHWGDLCLQFGVRPTQVSFA